MRLRRAVRWVCGVGVLVAAGCLLALVLGSPIPPRAWLSHPLASLDLSEGWNPYPLRLVRPPTAPLSAMAQLGRLLFFDVSLSSSGREACASCHSPAHHFGPPNDAAVMEGGPSLARQGVRAVPSLTYLERQPSFSVGPDGGEDETITLAQMVSSAAGAARATKTAADVGTTAGNLVPQGGMFWDGRADTLQTQALFPLLNPLEMDGGSIELVATKLRKLPYAGLFRQLFGESVLDDPAMLVSEALFAIVRYQIEDPSFHPYSSKFDFWLEGKAPLSPAELRGYLLFNDPAKANCGGCHLDKPSPDGLPPLFTDHQFEALAAPRNMDLRVNRDPAYFDLGICGPLRSDMQAQTQYCGMFLTPTLRNVATRHVFFHNGVFRSLQQVMDFYDFRDVDPARVYPRAQFDDVPRRYWANIDESDPPFGRKLGTTPAMSAGDERDIIAFLQTLTDGYRPRD